jgi:thiamine-phosphate pyrophosphorylase
VAPGPRPVNGGARLVQLRDKQASARTLVSEVNALRSCAETGDLQVIVNDRADVALVAAADGVHLGQSDLPPGCARQLLGAHALIGISTCNLEQARRALGTGVDYIAAGPVFRTTSKPDPPPTIGLEGLRAICRISHLPVVAIGGIHLDHVPALMAAGAASVAVIGDLIGYADVEGRAREYLNVLADCGSSHDATG